MAPPTPPTPADECARVYRAALACVLEGLPARVFVRELAATAGCDRLHDLSRLRGAFEGVVGADGMRRFAAFDESVADDRRAAQAAFRYRHWAAGELRAAARAAGAARVAAGGEEEGAGAA